MSRSNFSQPEAPRLYEATYHMDEQFKTLRGDIIQPFDDPVDERDEDYDVLWYRTESACRERCESAVEYWIKNRFLKPIDSDDEAFFLCRRFDEVSNFLQDFYLSGPSTIIEFGNKSEEEVLRWFLVCWWNEHGTRLANTKDLISFEDRYNRTKKA